MGTLGPGWLGHGRTLHRPNLAVGTGTFFRCRFNLWGGETLATTYYDNGDSQDVTTGGLVDLRAGLEYRLTNSPVALQMAVAYHVGNTTAKNGSLKFSRFPVELVGMYDFGKRPGQK